MPRYRFPIRSSTGRLVDDSEGVELPNESLARNYGMRVIEELAREEPEGYAGWSMEIMDGDRVVTILPFAKLH